MPASNSDTSIEQVIIEAVSERRVDECDDELTLATPLLGQGRVLDSTALVEVCIFLEDLAIDLGFEFDWTSESAMSRGRSSFRTIGSLIEEFRSQRDRQP